MKFRLIAVALTLIFITSLPAFGIYNGDSALNSKLVLTIAIGKDARTPFCSASMLTERIVVTAAHCVTADAAKFPELRFDISEIYVTQPGVDTNVDDFNSRVKVLKVVAIPGYNNIWNPTGGDESTQRNDIAFLFLAAPLVQGYKIGIATEDEIRNFAASGDFVSHYGYGLQAVNLQDGAPHYLQLKVLPNFPTKIDTNPMVKFDTSKVLFSQEDGRALCPGDSGSPWYGKFNGELKILAVTVAASGCRSAPPYNGSTLGTLIYPYLDLMNSEWEKFLREEPVLQAEYYLQDHRYEVAEKNGTLIVSIGCHGTGIKSELQILRNGVWEVLAPAYGMIPADKSCPATNPKAPWTVADISDGSRIRWRYWAPGQWDVLGNEFDYVKPKPAPPSKPSISATPTLSPVQTSPTPSTPTPSANSTTLHKVDSKKSTSIICVKGKLQKQVTGYSPKCPTGFRRK